MEGVPLVSVNGSGQPSQYTYTSSSSQVNQARPSVQFPLPFNLQCRRRKLGTSWPSCSCCGSSSDPEFAHGAAAAEAKEQKSFYTAASRQTGGQLKKGFLPDGATASTARGPLLINTAPRVSADTKTSAASKTGVR